MKTRLQECSAGLCCIISELQKIYSMENYKKRSEYLTGACYVLHETCKMSVARCNFKEIMRRLYKWLQPYNRVNSVSSAPRFVELERQAYQIQVYGDTDYFAPFPGRNGILMYFTTLWKTILLCNCFICVRFCNVQFTLFIWFYNSIDFF